MIHVLFGVPRVQITLLFPDSKKTTRFRFRMAKIEEKNRSFSTLDNDVFCSLVLRISLINGQF